MPTVSPPPPTPAPVPVSATTAAVSSNPPASLSQLPTGSILNAQVINLLSRGVAQIQTSQGTFDIRTALTLAVGAKLDLQLQRVGQQAQFLIRNADGISMPNQHGGQSTMSRASAQGSLAAGPRTPGGMALTGASADGNAVQKTVTSPQKLRVGTTIRASVIASTGKAKPAKAPSARPGAAKPVARPAIPASIRSAPDTGNQVFAARQGKSGETLKTERPSNVTTAKAKSRLKVGAAVHAKILNITKPGEPVRSNSPQTLQTSQAVIAGTVTGAGPAGTPQVQTPVGTLSMNGVARLPLGTNLVIWNRIIPTAVIIDLCAPNLSIRWT